MSLNHLSPRTKLGGAIALLLFATVMGPIFIRFAQRAGVPSLSIIFLRLLFASIVFAPIVWRWYFADLKTLNRTILLWAIAAGFFHAVGLVFLFFGLEYTSVLVNAVLRRTSPIWTILLEIFLLGAIFSQRVWWGLVVSVIGAMIVIFGGANAIEPGPNPVLGAVYSALNAIFFGGYVVIGRKIRNDLPFLLYIWLLFTSAGLFALLFVLFTGSPLLGHSWEGYFWVLVVAFFAQIIGHLPANYALRQIPATYLSILMQLAIVASAFFGFIYFGEIPSWLQVFGSGLILVGVFVASFQWASRK